jgi:hypothetical protein
MFIFIIYIKKKICQINHFKMFKETTKLLEKLRVLMRQNDVLFGNQLEAYIIPSSDAHGSEYLSEKDRRRAFITGFTGSSGDHIYLNLPF